MKLTLSNGIVVSPVPPTDLIYARSFYLDSMAENWSAWWQEIMSMSCPSPGIRNLVFSICISPILQNRWVFSETAVSHLKYLLFYMQYPNMFRYWDIDLNENNFVSIADKQSKLTSICTNRNYVSISGKTTMNSIRLQYKRLANRHEEKSYRKPVSQIVRGEDSCIHYKFIRGIMLTVIDQYRIGFMIS